MKINYQGDLGTLEVVNVTGSARVCFPPRREMTWQTGFSGQAMNGNPFPLDEEYAKHLSKGMRALNHSEQHARNIVIWARTGNAWAYPTTAGEADPIKSAAKTRKERKLADLIVFVERLREAKSGQIIPFPAWLSANGRQRLLEIANRGKK